MPPPPCAFLTPQEAFKIIDGLPAGSEIELAPILRGFSNPIVINGGTFGGQTETAESTLILSARGTGGLSGFDRLVVVPVVVETQSAPRTPGDPVQAFDTEMVDLQGSLFGDTDFASLTILIGAGLGGAGSLSPLPTSFGHTRLSERSGGEFFVDSFFETHWEISFTGAPGGALAGLTGTTQGMTRLVARGQRNRCVEANDGTGTTEFPPTACEYLSPNERHQILNGLPGGATIELSPRYRAFDCTQAGGVCGQPGGVLGGEIEQFDAELVLQAEGKGSLSDYRRTLRVPITVETHSGPRTPADDVQSFPTELIRLEGELVGDPDFEMFRIEGGSNFGLPSSGHTTLSDLGDGTFQVDSFFDIAYRIEFEGAPGSALAGSSGTTEAELQVRAQPAWSEPLEPDNGTGTATLPPEGGAYISPTDTLTLFDGMPPGTALELAPKMSLFFCGTPPCGQAGGDLGGEREVFTSTLSLEVTGNPNLAGFKRQLEIPVTVETHSAPRQPTRRGVAATPQIFDTDLFHLQGTLTGDPDFDELAITAGTDNSLPSPGHTTLTDLGDGAFQVDSFFDIAYRIDFEGAPGGTFDGLSGSNEGTLRITACAEDDPPAHSIAIAVDARPNDANDVPFSGDFGAFSLDDDTDPALSVRRSFHNLSPGVFMVTGTPPAGWSIFRILCDDPDAGTTVDPSTGQANIDLDFDESITCTFETGIEAIFTDGFESGNALAWSNVVP